MTRDELTLSLLVRDALKDPDVAYVIVADEDGKIVAHGDLAAIGKKYQRSASLAPLTDTVLVRSYNDQAGGEIIDFAVPSLLTQVRGRLVQQHYNQGMQLFRDEKLPAAISEWRTVLQYDPAHDGAKRNIDQAQRLLKGLQERQQKQGK